MTPEERDLHFIMGTGPYAGAGLYGILSPTPGAEEAERRAREHPSRQVLRAKAREHRKALARL